VAAGLDEIPVYVRAGSILPLGPVVQNTSELAGKPLELQVYPGKDATFTLVEDEGVNQDYLKGKTRRTTFRWDDAKKRLSWKQGGEYSGEKVCQDMRVTVLYPQAKAEVECALKPSGVVKPRANQSCFNN
jgi:alpha-glucosidase